MNFCIGLTLYNPSEEEIMNIYNYYNSVEKIYIYDNSENTSSHILRIIDSMDKVYYFKSNQNDGLSRAFNYMCKQAVQQGFDFICLLDQDSIFMESDMLKIVNEIQKNKEDDVAIYAPHIEYISNKTDMNKKTTEKNRQKDNKVKVIDWAITSGSFVSLSIYSKTSGFDENYFIDRLDYDYSIMVRTLGYRILQVQESNLYQFLGDQVDNITNFTIFEHNPLRHYYIMRNRLYYYNKNIENFGILRLLFTIYSSSLKHVFSIILFETDKSNKLKMVYRGIKDYKKRKLQKIEI